MHESPAGAAPHQIADSRFRDGFHYAPAALAMLGAHGEWADPNRAFCSLLGYAPEELRELPLDKITHPPDAERLLAHLDRALEAEEPEETLVRFLRRGGGTTEVAVSASVVRASSGRPIHYLVHLRRADVGAAPSRPAREPPEVGVCLVHEERLVHVNPAFARILGRPAEELLEHGHVADLVTARARGALLEAFRALSSERERAISGIIRVVRPDGSTSRLSVEGSRTSIAGIPVIAGAVTDLAAGARSEERRQAQTMEALSRLASTVAHEFGNVLTVVRGNSQRLITGLGPEHPMLGALEDIRSVSNRASDLTRQLLSIGGRQRLQPKVLDLNNEMEVLGRIVRQLIGSGVRIRYDLAPDLDPIHADPTMIEQLLLSLVVNAYDSLSEGGEVVVETTNKRLTPARHWFVSKPGRYVRLCVRDNGTGLEPEARARLFEPSYPARAHGGTTGLGLSAVYGIVRQSGGYIQVDSAPSIGTEVRVYLPVADV